MPNGFLTEFSGGASAPGGGGGAIRESKIFKFCGGVFLDLKLQARKPGDKSLAVWNPGGCVLESYHVCHVNFLLISGWG